jgi:hypothetical protein
LHKEFFPRHSDFETELKASVYKYYRKWIFKPISEHQEREQKLRNRRDRLYRQVIVNNKIRTQASIPTVVGYRNYFK